MQLRSAWMRIKKKERVAKTPTNKRIKKVDLKRLRSIMKALILNQNEPNKAGMHLLFLLLMDSLQFISCCLEGIPHTLLT